MKTLSDFDFSFQPSLKREQIESLATLGFIERKENVVFLGPPGVGKTHLAIGLAIAAAQHGRRVYYGTLADLITSLEEAHAAGKLLHRMKTLTHPSLLVVDEIGYLPVSRTGAMHFFQLMSRRYEHASTALTSNKSFEEWGEIFGDEVMAAALIDRLLHHCHIVNIRGNSFRMRQHLTSGSSSTRSLTGTRPPPRLPHVEHREERNSGRNRLVTQKWDISVGESGTSVTGVDIAAALFIWYTFRTTLEAVGVGSPLPVIQYEDHTNWVGIGLGVALILQGLLGYAVLQALASITEDVTGIRISNRAIALAQADSSARQVE